MATERKVFACKITYRNTGTVCWLDLGLQVVDGEIQRPVLLDLGRVDDASAWGSVDIHKYGGRSPSVEECAREYITSFYSLS